MSATSAPAPAPARVRWARALGVGAATSRSRGGALYRAALVAATAVLAISGMAVVATAATYHGAQARTAHRSARDAQVFPGEKVVATYTDRPVSTTIGYATIITVQPPAGSAGFTSPPPPGLTRWPAPGTVYLSPALAATHRPGSPTPWGRLAGVVAPVGLASPTGEFGYARPAAQATVGNAFPITGFGLSSDQFPLPIGEVGRRAPLSTFVALVLFFAVLPALVLVVLAARIGAADCARRTATLEALGVARTGQALVRAGAALPAIAVGVGIAAVVALGCALAPRLPLPATGVTLIGGDLRAAWPGLLTAAAAAVVIALGAASLAPRPRVRARAASARVGAGRDGHREYLALVAAGALAALVTWPRWNPPGVAGLALLGLSAAVALATLPSVVATVVIALSHLVGALARNSATMLVLTRQAIARPRAIERTALGVIVAVGVLGVAQLFSSQLSTPQIAAQAAATRLGQSMTTITADDASPAVVADIASTTAPRAAQVWVRGALGKPPALAATCPDLRALGARCPAPGQRLTIAEVDPRLGELTELDATFAKSKVTALATAPTTSVSSLVVLSPHGAPLPLEAISAAAFQHGLQAEPPTTSGLDGARLSRHQARWVALFGIAALAVLITSATLSASSELRTTARAMAPMLLLSGRRSTAAAIVAWHQALPMTIALTAGLGFHLTFAIPATSAGNDATLSTTTVLAVAIGGAALITAAWATATIALNGYLHRQRQNLML